MKEYPLVLDVEGWFYRMTELSNNFWQLKASSIKGPTLSYEGADYDALIKDCEKDAKNFNKKYNL